MEVDDSGGTLRDLSQYVIGDLDVTIEAIIEESHAAGDSWGENLFTGVKKLGDITIEGFYDDTATSGPDVVLNRPGGGGTFKATWGGTKTTSSETVIKSYSRKASRDAMTRFTAVLVGDGAVTEV